MGSSQETETIYCRKCGGVMREGTKTKSYFTLTGLVFSIVPVVVYFLIVASVIVQLDLDSVPPIFIGLAPFVLVPFIMLFRRKKVVKGVRCAGCGKFVEIRRIRRYRKRR